MLICHLKEKDSIKLLERWLMVMRQTKVPEVLKKLLVINNIIEVGIIDKMPANLLTHKFLILQMPHSKKIICCKKLDTMIFLKCINL